MFSGIVKETGTVKKILSYKNGKTIQPLPITGQRVLTEQEIVNSFSNFPYFVQ